MKQASVWRGLNAHVVVQTLFGECLAKIECSCIGTDVIWRGLNAHVVVQKLFLESENVNVVME